MAERGFRPRQKGVECKVDGCTNWCVSNDMCANHNMALHRYGSIHGKPKKKHVCKGCGKEFEHKYDRTEYCSIACYGNTDEQKQKRYQAVKKWRSKNLVKARKRDNLGRRTRRRFPDKESCCINRCDVIGEAHHPDYEKPYEIVWLCRKHHREAHSGGKSVFGGADIRRDTVWRDALEKYGAEFLEGERFLRGKAILNETTP